MDDFSSSSSYNNNNNGWNNKTRVPLGFIFLPTDVELVVSYLMRKMKNEALPSQDIIKEVDLYSYADPYALIASHEFMAKEYEWYFFTRRNKRHVNGSRVNRTTSNGFWKASGGEKPIHHNGEIVGKKMSLVFHYNGTSSKPEKTNWLMQEFKLETDDKKGDDWVICKVYNTKDNLQITPGVQEFSCNANYSEAQPMPIDDEVQKVCGYSNQEGFEQSNQVMESSSDSTFQQHLDDKNDGPIFEGMFSDEDINNPNLSIPIDLLFNEEDRLLDYIVDSPIDEVELLSFLHDNV